MAAMASPLEVSCLASERFLRSSYSDSSDFYPSVGHEISDRLGRHFMLHMPLEANRFPHFDTQPKSENQQFLILNCFNV